MLSVAEAYGLRFLFPSRDDVIGASLRDHGEFARPESDLISTYLARLGDGGCFVDVGANIGAICLPVAKTHPARPVIAIEAHRGLHSILATNALSNGLYNVSPYHAAAGPTAGLAEFPATSLGSTGNFGTLRFGMEASRMETVRMLTLDSIAPSNTQFIKIDVEGFELEVLKGAPQTLSTTRPAWFLEANPENDGPARQTMRVMLEAGYRLYWFFAPFITTRLRDRDNPQIHGDTNFLALPEGMENIWDLVPITSPSDQKPASIASYAYLNRY